MSSITTYKAPHCQGVGQPDFHEAGSMEVNITDDRSLRVNRLKGRKKKEKSKRVSETLHLSNSPEKEPFLSNTDK